MINKKSLILVNLIVFGFNSFGQTSSYFDLDLKSKYGTNVKANLSIQHRGDYKFDKHNPLIKEINLKIIDSLDFYNAIEMYTTAIDKIGKVAEHFYKENFTKNDIKFYKLYLLQVKIPYELKILHENQNETSQKYLETLITLKNIKDSLDNIIQTKGVNRKIKKEARKELKILEYSEYYRKTYDKQVLKLILNNKIN